MFIESLKKTNPALLEYAFDSIKNNAILPDTYILDLDAITENGKKMLEISKPLNIKMLFMLKQIGRNPIVAKRLMDIGFDGVVAVDFKESLLMARHQIPLGNIGHLVQIPKAALYALLQHKPEVITVYSYDKILEINETASSLNMIQPLLFRVSDPDSTQYSGQEAGFHTSELKEILQKMNKLKHVSFGGLTVFPALLYNADNSAVEETSSFRAMTRARKIVDDLGYHDYMVNVPSCSCCATLPLIHSLGGNCAEPGHGLTGTTPLHCGSSQPERIGYVYVTQVSHTYDDKTYCYGGGEYRRGHLEKCIIGPDIDKAVTCSTRTPDLDSIDYHFEVDGIHHVGDIAAMCFRTQIFTTRSHVAVVEGISTGSPKLIEIDTALGEKAGIDWR